MATCTFKRMKSWKLCFNDLKNKCTVVERTMLPNHPDSVTAQHNTLNELFTFYSAIETKKGVQNSSGLSLQDNVTHKIYARYLDCQSFVFDVKKHRIAVRDKLYSIESIENLNDDDVTLIFYCKQEGDRINWGSHS